MKFFKSLYEFNKGHLNIIKTNDKMFTLSYEIELESINGYDSFSEMEYMFREKFSNFMNKWDDYVQVIHDNSLIGGEGDDNKFLDYDYQEISLDDIDIDDSMDVYDDDSYNNSLYFKGLEIVLDDYFESLSDGFKYIDDFFNDYNKQKMFLFTKNTGLHINIGFKTKTKPNILRGYLLLNEEYALRGWKDRKNNMFTESYREKFDQIVCEYLKSKYDNTQEVKNDLKNIQNYLNEKLIKLAYSEDEKSIGFNIQKLSNGYIEFRYGGGKDISKKLIEDKTNYYSNIINAIHNDDYRKSDYYRILWNYLQKCFEM